MEWPEEPGFPPCFNTQVADATRAANTLQSTMEWPGDLGFLPCFNTPVADATFLYGAYRSTDVLFFWTEKGRKLA